MSRNMHVLIKSLSLFIGIVKRIESYWQSDPIYFHKKKILYIYFYLTKKYIFNESWRLYVLVYL